MFKFGGAGLSQQQRGSVVPWTVTVTTIISLADSDASLDCDTCKGGNCKCHHIALRVLGSSFAIDCGLISIFLLF